ncbi:hypothetical protein GCM10027275_24850 [Rhabdobacter roseus]|uniref:Uncharacterized protein n=1 Tax=Rhabdobacter roseus TaxID=1655419 RepID=A0A840TNB5_9BACT|nr:hypothetical protein [Rhabdobacter roseus]MBB5284425.1 hypothetical protein [Rhabdobacter roseus]
MAITIVREPDELSFSLNKILYELQSDARVVNPGQTAINNVMVQGPLVAGTVIALRWNGLEVRMQAVTTVTNQGFEFPAGDGSAAYVQSIVEYFAENYYLSRDFEVSYQAIGIYNYIRFGARQVGRAYEFLLQDPPGAHLVTMRQGIEKVVRTNFRIHVECWMEKVDGSGFEQILSEALDTDESGGAQWNLSELLHPQLAPDLPVWAGMSTQTNTKSIRRYYIRYAEAWGDPFQIGKIQSAQPKHVTLGGTPYKDGAAATVLEKVSGGQPDKDFALRYGPETRTVFPDEPQYLTFLNVRDDIDALSVRIRAQVVGSGETEVKVLSHGECPRYGKVTAAVGFAQLSLHTLLTTQNVKQYTVQFFSGATAVSRKYAFLLDVSYRPYRRYFAFLNSLGAMDVVTTWGKQSSELQLTKRTAVRFLSPDYLLTDGTYSDWNISGRQRFDAATGYRTRREIIAFRDFYQARYKYRLTAGKALPISLVNSSVKEGQDGDNYFAALFEYTYQYEDDTWSEDRDATEAEEYLPPPGFQGVTGDPILIQVPPQQGFNEDGSPQFDSEPTEGSPNIVRSGAIFEELKKKQEKLPAGSLGQYLRGNGTLGSLAGDVIPLIGNELQVFKADELPEWMSSANFAKNLSNMPLDYQVPSGFYFSPNGTLEQGWPIEGRVVLQRTLGGAAGGRMGADLVQAEGGGVYARTINEAGEDSPWVELGGEDLRPPRFPDQPTLFFTTGQPFSRIINLANQQISHHTNEEMYIKALIKGPAWAEAAFEALQATITGTPTETGPTELILLVTDQDGLEQHVIFSVDVTDKPVSPEVTIAAELYDMATGSPVFVGNITAGISLKWLPKFNILFKVTGQHNKVGQAIEGPEDTFQWGIPNGENAVPGGAMVGSSQHWIFGPGGHSNSQPQGAYIIQPRAYVDDQVVAQPSIAFTLTDNAVNITARLFDMSGSTPVDKGPISNGAEFDWLPKFNIQMKLSGGTFDQVSSKLTGPNGIDQWGPENTFGDTHWVFGPGNHSNGRLPGEYVFEPKAFKTGDVVAQPSISFSLKTDQVQACGIRPVIQSIDYANATGLGFTLSPSSATRIDWAIKQGNNIIREGTELVPTQGGGVGLSFGTIQPGNYILDVKGKSCTSIVSSASFTVAAAPQSGIYITSGFGANAIVKVPSVPTSGGAYPLPVDWDVFCDFGAITANLATVQLEEFLNGQWEPCMISIQSTTYQYPGTVQGEYGFFTSFLGGELNNRTILNGPNAPRSVDRSSTRWRVTFRAYQGATLVTTKQADFSFVSIQPRVASQGRPDVLDLTITGAPGAWLLTDNNTSQPQGGKEWWYRIGNEFVKQQSRLINYPWNSNNPGSVMKMGVNIGASGIGDGTEGSGPVNFQFFNYADVGGVSVFFFN